MPRISLPGFAYGSPIVAPVAYEGSTVTVHGRRLREKLEEETAAA